MPDPRPLCWAPYHLDSGFPQWCALVIAHACFKKAIAFSGTGHGSSRDGAMRNSSNSQQSSDTTMVISLNSMFTSGMAFQSKKPFSIFGLHGKNNWQMPTFNSHAQLPSSSAFLFAGSPGQEGCSCFPLQLLCLGLGTWRTLAHRERARSGFLWWVIFALLCTMSKACRLKHMMSPGRSPASFWLSLEHAAS